MRIAILTAAAAIAMAAGTTASADVLANWTFETSAPATAGPHVAEAGNNAAGSNASGFHAGASTYSSPVGNGSARSFSSTNWQVNDYYQFTTSTSGYQSITFSWSQTSSNTGPRDFQLWFSTDGTNFNQIGSTFTVLANATPNPTWSSGTPQPVFDFAPQSASASADNQATVWFRLINSSTVSANGGTVASGGTNRVDNVVISGTQVPAPGAAALLGLSGLIVARRRR